MLSIKLWVKFRFLRIDIGRFHEHWLVPLPIPTDTLTRPEPVFEFNERGIHMIVELRPRP